MYPSAVSLALSSIRWQKVRHDGLQGAKEEMRNAGYEGVLLGGNYVAGVALGKCVEYAYEYANQIEAYLQSKQSTVGIETTARQDEPFFV